VTIERQRLSRLGRKHARNTSGFAGVSRCARNGKWKAAIQFKGSYKFLGRFDTPNEASEAYQNAVRLSRKSADELRVLSI